MGGNRDYERARDERDRLEQGTHGRRAQARSVDRLLAQSGDASRGNRPDCPLVRRRHGAGFDRHPGGRSCDLQGLRRQAALRRRPQPQDLHFPAQSEPAHSAASGQIGGELSCPARRVMADIPLIRNFDAGAGFAFRNRRPIRVEEFLGEVRRLADSLPDRRYVVNLCADRYQFAVGLCAALLRRQVNLLPPNVAPDLLKRLSLEYPGLYCLSDGAVQPPLQIETFLYPPTGNTVSASVPQIPEEQIAVIGFTSGSTGQPTPNPKSWGALAKSGLAEFERLGVAAHRNMSVLGTVPQQHSYGLESTG